MFPFRRSLMIAAFVATGAVADHLMTTTTPTTAPAVTASSTTAAFQESTAATTLDSAIEQAYAVASPSVVYVQNVGVGSGSGVIYDTSGDIVTNAHVVQGAQSLVVTLSTGKHYAARLVGTDVADDLAVIRINAAGLPAATFASASNIHVAQNVLAIGNPLDLQQSVASGLVSALGRTVQEANGAYLPNAIQTSAPINPGNSGGALVALNGMVIGIPTLEATDPQNNNGGAAQGIGFAVPSTRVTFIANQIIATGRVAHTGRAYLGVGSVDVSSLANSYYSQQIAVSSGAVVQQIAAGSPAETAGLQVGDVITSLNNQTISGTSDLLTALAQLKPGATIALTINRNGQNMQVHVHVGELPAA